MNLRQHQSTLERRLWVATYLVAFLCPLVLLAFAPARGADQLTLFSIALGFLGFTGIVLQLVIPSRAPQFTAAFGIGLLLRLHRYMGGVVLLLVAAHIGVFVWHNQGKYVQWLYPIHGPFKAQAGWVAAAALLLIAFTSYFRRRLKLGYETWRYLHIALSTLIVSGAFVHVLLISWFSSIESLRWLVVAALMIGLVALVYLRVGRPFAALGSPFVIREVIAERGGSTTLQLEAVNHPGISFRPGQFAWIKVQGKPFSLTEHPFSFASSAFLPSQPSFTIKGLGDFTREVGKLIPGTPVIIDGPHGAYEPVLPDAGYVLIVGGVGITPAMSIIRTCVSAGDISRPLRLIYGAQTWDEVTFREELLDAQHLIDLEVLFVITNPPDDWQGYSGRIDKTTLPGMLPTDAMERNYFVCGPPRMIDGVMHALHDIGVPDALVYADRFDSV